MFSYFPPTYATDDTSSNNNLFRIRIGRRHPFPAAVTMQEIHQWRRKWLCHHGPAFISLFLGLLTGTDLGVALGFLLFVGLNLSAAIKPIRRQTEFLGQVIEAVAVHTTYNETLQRQVRLAAEQLTRGNYPDRLGTEDWSADKIETQLLKMVPAASKWLKAHEALFRKAQRYFA